MVSPVLHPSQEHCRGMTRDAGNKQEGCSATHTQFAPLPHDTKIVTIFASAGVGRSSGLRRDERCRSANHIMFHFQSY